MIETYNYILYLTRYWKEVRNMILATKTRLYPTKQQEKLMWQSVGVTRLAYNWTLTLQENFHNTGNSFVKDTEARRIFTELKQSKGYEWLYETSSDVHKQAIKDACKAYISFFNGISDKPRFKSRKKTKPSFFNDPVKLRVAETYVHLTIIGNVKIKKNAIPISDKYYNPRITHDGKYWYLSVGSDIERDKPLLTKTCLGIDLGISTLAYCSDKTKHKNINKTKKVRDLKKKLKRKKRQVSRKYEMNKQKNIDNGLNPFNKSNNIIKLEREIKLIYRKLTNIRNNYNHKVTNSIVKTKPWKIVVEDLNIKGMMKNKHLAEKIAEQRFYDFKMKIKYKCELNGILFQEVPRNYPSSKRCCICGHINHDLRLSQREYHCYNCTTLLDRDYNASVNLALYGLNRYSVRDSSKIY